MNLPELIDKLHDEESCYKHLEKVRWPKGVHCLKCDSKSVSTVTRTLKHRHGTKTGETYQRRVYDCNKCRHQFSATAGTIFHDTHLPLRTWMLAIHRLAESKKGVSALQLQRELGLRSYRTAWYLCHRIREVLKQSKGPGLKGIIEADETYLKGKGIPKGEKPKRGRGSQRTTPVVGIKERGGEVRAKAVPNLQTDTILEFVKAVIAEKGIEAFHTDELPAYKKLASIPPHSAVKHSETYVMGDVHTNSVESFWSLLKRGIIGSYHRISAKHLQRYVDEYCWRSNNRENRDMFGLLLRMAARGRHIRYSEITGPGKHRKTGKA